jgi:hypothetical protein
MIAQLGYKVALMFLGVWAFLIFIVVIAPWVWR